MKRGHSNLYANKTESYSDDLPDVAKIPLCGGASVFTVKTLPPLALREDEWREIGVRMGWTFTASANRPETTSRTEAHNE